MGRLFRTIVAVVLLPLTAAAGTLDSSQGALNVTRVLSGLTEPWSLAFLPDGDYLVTERGGRLLHVGVPGGVTVVSGVPRVVVQGQGGLLDVLVPRDFAQSGEILLSFAMAHEGRAVTALASGKLNDARDALTGLRLLFRMRSPSTGGRHFGGRIVEAPDGRIFLTLGERGDRDAAQDLSNHNGTIVRINRDGSIPSDNPFVGQSGALPEIWSYGHRNPQGAALDGGGQLWIHEHGARGGDEVNRVRPGANYGWPVIAYGRHYTGGQIGEGTHKEGMEQPAHYWDPSIAPSGLMVYSGRMWPAWRGHFFVGSLKFDMISRLDPGAGWAEERLSGPETDRVRDVREAPDGSIWFLSVGQGALYRISRTPADG